MGRRALGRGRRGGGRRGGPSGAAAGAALVLCAAVLTGCGGSEEGYLATGTSDGASARPVPPRDGVEMVPLDDADGAGRKDRGGRDGDGGGARPGGGKTSGAPSSSGSSSPSGDGGSGGGTASAVPSSGGSPGTSDSGGGTGGAQGGASSGGTTGGGTAGGGSGGTGGTESGGTGGGEPGGSPSSPSSPQQPTGPAALTAGDPERAPAADRWCEYVTVQLTNKGGAAATAGTITFSTHVIDALGIDWATVETKGSLPVPIAAGASKEQTWRVCLEEWRVPLGMRVETQDVALDWS